MRYPVPGAVVRSAPGRSGTAELESRVCELERQRDALAGQLRAQQRVAHVGALTSGLAHETANHMTVLLGAAELGLLHGDVESLREALQAVRDRGARLQETVDAFLCFVRGSRDREVRFSVCSALRRLDELVGPMARTQGVTLMVSCATRSELLADAQLVEQVFVNLAINGIRAAALGGARLVVSATDTDNGAVRVIFRDTGPGIRDDVRRGLFRPFVTGHEESGGTGLGLYVVRQVVQRYEGRITVESCSSGTRIEVVFPAAPAA